MSVMRLPNCLFHEEEEAEVECSTYVRNAVNKVYEELEESFEGLKYTGDREHLARCHTRCSNLFKKMSLVFKIMEHIDAIKETMSSLRATKDRHMNFVSVADSLAYMFEDFKAQAVPPLNIQNTLRFYKDYNLLYPKILVKIRTETDYKEIDRLMHIYLLREDVQHFEKNICEGVLTLRSQHFVFKLTLCGDVMNPEWKLFDIDRQNKVPFLRCLPSEIRKLDFFMGMYSSLEEARTIHSRLTSDGFLKTLVTGTFKDFTLDYIAKLRIQIKEGRLVGVFSFKNDRKYFCEDILHNYELATQNALREIDAGVHFSIENKIAIDDLTFHDIAGLKEHLYKGKDDRVFYNLFVDRKFVKNYRREEFGSRNVFMRKRDDFLCVKLNRTKEINDTNHIDVNLFVGKVLEENHLYYTELHFHNTHGLVLTNYDTSSTHTNTISADALRSFLCKNLGFIFVFFDLMLVEKDLRIILGDEIQIMRGKEKCTIMARNGCYRIEGHAVHNAEDIRSYLVFRSRIKEHEEMRAETQGGVHSFDFNGIRFSLSFAGTTVVTTENKTIAKIMSGDSSTNFFKSCYYLCIYRMLPSFVSRSYLIFNLRMVVRDQVVIKVKDAGTFLVKKSYFTTSHFQLASHDYHYFECKADNVHFFRALRSIYIKERFLVLSDVLRLRKNANAKDLAINFLHKGSSFALCLDDDDLSIVVNGVSIRAGLLDRLRNAFYEGDDIIALLENA